MSADKQESERLQFYPLTTERWPDFDTLFGPRGAYGGCWCMWWRLTRSQFEQQQGESNRQAMQAIVARGEVPGILGYWQGEPIAWCSVAPRQQFASLNRSPVLKPLDDTPVWSLVCLFVSPDYRGRGVTLDVIRGAIDYVKEQGGEVVEAYPTVPRESRLPPVSSFMGTPAMFERAGFVACARPSASRMVMRYEVRGGSER